MVLIKKVNADSFRLHYFMGRTYEEAGNRDEAIQEYKSALEDQSTCAECHAALGGLLSKNGKADEAKIHLNKAKLFSPNQGE